MTLHGSNRQLCKLSNTFCLYIHYPYCSRICSFCAFNKYRLPFNFDYNRLENAYFAELDNALQKYNYSNSSVRSIYFGGGTPSLARSSLFCGILQVLSRNGCQVTNETEITIEANPSSFDKVYRWGLTRVSIGVQSFNNHILQLSNRDHNAQEAIQVLERASFGEQLRHGFSFDLMFGFPNQTLASWKADLDVALPFVKIGRHTSLYELTLEPGTPLYRSVKNGSLQLPSEEVKEEMYTYAIDRLREIGILRYEVSNFGRTSRNNFAIWQGTDYLGIGPGAHSRIQDLNGKIRIIRIPEPERWMASVESRGHGTAKSTLVTQKEYMDELVVTGLRTVAGISRQTFQEYTNKSLDTALNLNRVYQLCQDGFLEIFSNSDGLEELDVPSDYNYDNGGVRATDKGLRMLDSLLPEILESN